MVQIDTKATDGAAVDSQPKEEAEKEDKDTTMQDSQVPIKMIQSLISLLNRDTNQRQPSPVESSAFVDDEELKTVEERYSTKQLQKLWGITLDSLISKTFEVKKLVEAGVLEKMIQAFLKSTEEIKQTTFIQILTISEKIAMVDKNGKSICNLLFMTLKSTNWNTESPTNVTYLVCQGWFDILIHGVF